MASTMTETSLTMRTFAQFDGSMWRQYESRNAIFLLTEVGRKLIAADHIGRLLRHYADDYSNDREGPEDARHFLAEGVEARVFSVGNTRLAIKERRPDGADLFGSLNRLDKLIHAITVDSNCPQWIGVPQHYGIVMLKEDPRRQFMLMEKIDEGVTVGDVLHYNQEPREPHLRESLDRTYGPITPEFTEEIAGRFGMALGELRHALLAKYMKPEEYIPDIDKNPYNIVLEPLPEPLDGSYLKYWVIDQ